MKKMLTGTVVSDKMEKTVVVLVERKYRHAMYKKVVKSHKKYKAHCEIEGVQEGDTVVIGSVAPISKQKSFIVLEKKN
jgi:small subunit ribosomal protein S17